MFYRKNLKPWHRTARLIGGIAMIGCGFLGFQGLAIGYLIGGVGIITAATGFVGFCPMCAFAVPRSKEK